MQKPQHGVFVFAILYMVMIKRNIFVSSFFVALLLGSFFTVGSIFFAHASEISNAKEEERILKDKLEELEEEIKQQEKLLQSQKGQSNSIQGVISQLKAEISKTRSEIDKKELLIRRLSGEINDKQETIVSLSNELNREQKSLAKLIRKINEIESLSVIEMLLSSQSVSDFYKDIDSFMTINEALYNSANNIKQVRSKTDAEKLSLEEKKAEEADIKYELEQDRKKVESKKSEQDNLLTVSKNQEQTYEQLIAARKAQVAAINARLFELAGDVQGGGISFEDALAYAREASGKTGVRPALILAVLKQESDLGKNVGTCNRPGDSRTWRDIMPGPTSGSWRDDQTAFQQITRELGISPDGQPLSCPLASGGWGGAMGPSQFIPATWLDIRNRLGSLLGISLPNPWNPRHAVHATALYMSDLGASTGGYTAERNAACKYYSGRSCGQSSLNNTFYGDQVLAKAATIQKDIDFLEDN
jgi:peptidoglycan hydrolase CwlO-like protein